MALTACHAPPGAGDRGPTNAWHRPPRQIRELEGSVQHARHHRTSRGSQRSLAAFGKRLQQLRQLHEVLVLDGERGRAPIQIRELLERHAFQPVRHDRYTTPKERGQVPAISVARSVALSHAVVIQTQCSRNAVTMQLQFSEHRSGHVTGRNRLGPSRVARNRSASATSRRRSKVSSRPSRAARRRSFP